jgi:nitronate monooxygenase
MSRASDHGILDLLGIELPIIQAPMAGPNDSALAIAVSTAGGLGSLPCAMLSPAQIEAEWERMTSAAQVLLPSSNNSRTGGRGRLSYNLNFFAHRPPPPDEAREDAWRARLAPYYAELGLPPPPSAAAAAGGSGGRAPFDAALCSLVERLRPAVVSFHFGLPAPPLLARVRATGAAVLGCATTVDEARWLEKNGCDAVIVQGAEAGGHRGCFLPPNGAGAAVSEATATAATAAAAAAADTAAVFADYSAHPGLFALLPQVTDAVRIPVVAAGAIADPRGAAAAVTLGANAIQVGTAFLYCNEARPTPAHADALARAREDTTVVTNVMSGRPARGLINRAMRELGPFSTLAPAFPGASTALAPLRAAAERAAAATAATAGASAAARARAGDFAPLWAGQAAALGRATVEGLRTPRSAAELTRVLGRAALAAARRGAA